MTAARRAPTASRRPRRCARSSLRGGPKRRREILLARRLIVPVCWPASRPLRAGFAGGRQSAASLDPGCAHQRWPPGVREKSGRGRRSHAEIYPEMLEMLRELRPIMAQLERKNADLARQLRRAAPSVALNTADHDRGRRAAARFRASDDGAVHPTPDERKCESPGTSTASASRVVGSGTSIGGRSVARRNPLRRRGPPHAGVEPRAGAR